MSKIETNKKENVHAKEAYDAVVEAVNAFDPADEETGMLLFTFDKEEADGRIKGSTTACNASMKQRAIAVISLVEDMPPFLAKMVLTEAAKACQKNHPDDEGDTGEYEMLA